MTNNVPSGANEKPSKSNELSIFGLSVFVILPLLFAGLFGAYGFIIWMINLFGPVHS